MCSEPVEARGEGLVEIDHEVIFDAQRAAVSWDQFRGMFSTRYVPQDEKEKLARRFLKLKQDLESVTESTGMFIERAMFCPEFASEQAQMSRNPSMLKRGGVSDSSCLRRDARPCWYRRRPPCGVS